MAKFHLDDNASFGIGEQDLWILWSFPFGLLWMGLKYLEIVHSSIFFTFWCLVQKLGIGRRCAVEMRSHENGSSTDWKQLATQRKDKLKWTMASANRVLKPTQVKSMGHLSPRDPLSSTADYHEKRTTTRSGLVFRRAAILLSPSIYPNLRKLSFI